MVICQSMYGPAVPPPVRPRPSNVTQVVVRGAHALVLRVSSFFGLAPLWFESRTNGFAVTLSNGMCIYSYLLLTILIIASVASIAWGIIAGTELTFQMNMFQTVINCHILIFMITVGVGVYTAPRRMREMLNSLESIASVDETIGAQYSAVTERKSCGLTIAALVYFFIVTVNDFCFHIVKKTKSDRQWDFVRNYVGMYILWYVLRIVELQFALTALSVRTRFQAVNDALALTAKHVSLSLEKLNEPRPVNMFTIRAAPAESRRRVNTDNQWMDSLPRQDHTVIIGKSNSGEPHLLVPPCEAIRQLSSLHGTLCEVIHRINDSCGLLLIFTLITMLLHVVVTPYYFIMTMVTSSFDVYNFVIQCFWCATQMLAIFIIIEPCHLTAAENKKTQEIVCSLMTLAPPTGALSSRLQLFSQQLMLSSAAYSPLGLCILDRPLVVSIISAVTTYLVILIQFQQDDD